LRSEAQKEVVRKITEKVCLMSQWLCYGRHFKRRSIKMSDLDVRKAVEALLYIRNVI